MLGLSQNWQSSYEFRLFITTREARTAYGLLQTRQTLPLFMKWAVLVSNRYCFQSGSEPVFSRMETNNRPTVRSFSWCLVNVCEFLEQTLSSSIYRSREIGLNSWLRWEAFDWSPWHLTQVILPSSDLPS